MGFKISFYDYSKEVRKHKWILFWENKEKNTLINVVVKHIAEYKMPLFCDEFSISSIPRVCFDIILKE